MSDALLEWIPNDVWIVIFGSLNIRDLGRVARVCKLFNKLSEDDFIWRSKYSDNFTSRQNSKFAEMSRATNENRGWKIRFRFALNNLPLHTILFGSSQIHKLCVHIKHGQESNINDCCTTDRFWRGVYHHSIPYEEFLRMVHNATASTSDRITFFPSNLYMYFHPKSNEIHIRYFKCLMVGDKQVGKTTLLNSLTYMEYKPDQGTSHEFIVNVMVYKRILSFHIEVVSEMDQLSQLPNDYDVILACFSTSNRQSFKNVTTWVDLSKDKMKKAGEKLDWKGPVDPELEGLWQVVSSKIVLIGTHLDVALDQQVKQDLLVSFREADRMAESIKANLYRECSAKKLTGLADLFVSVSGLYTPLEKLEPEIPSRKPGMQGTHHTKMNCVIM